MVPLYVIKIAFNKGSFEEGKFKKYSHLKKRLNKIQFENDHKKIWTKKKV